MEAFTAAAASSPTGKVTVIFLGCHLQSVADGRPTPPPQATADGKMAVLITNTTGLSTRRIETVAMSGTTNCAFSCRNCCHP